MDIKLITLVTPLLKLFDIQVNIPIEPRKSETFEQWKFRNYKILIRSWESYINVLKSISFEDYCVDFFNGDLFNVQPKSYKNCLHLNN